MYARVTEVEVDLATTTIDEVLTRFRAAVLPALQEQPGLARRDRQDAAHGAAHFGDRQQHVRARPDVRIAGEEPAIDDGGGEIDLDAAAVRHALARVARDVDENALDALGIDPQRRAETLSVAEFTAIARALS